MRHTKFCLTRRLATNIINLGTIGDRQNTLQEHDRRNLLLLGLMMLGRLETNLILIRLILSTAYSAKPLMLATLVGQHHLVQ